MLKLGFRAGLPALLFATTLAAQTAESIPFRAILSPRNEVPAITGYDASGTATVWLHIVRNAQGNIISGSADFGVRYAMPGEVTLTGLHIHRGAEGTNGPVVIDSGLRGQLPDATGRAGIARQGAIANQTALEAARDLLADPAGFYVNLHSTQYPGGVIRGQLQPAWLSVTLTQLDPRNEVPAVTSNARGAGAMVLLATVDSNGFLTSAEATFEVNYSGFAEGTSFTGFHVHRGAAAANGPVTVDSGLRGGANAVPAGPNGAGTLSYSVEVNLQNAAAADTVYGLFTNPQGYYMNLHTLTNAGGEIRGQMRLTDRMSFPALMRPDREVPAITGLDATGVGRFTAHTIRNEDGTIAAGYAVFDVNHRFPATVTFTGLHIHNGAAGVNGPVVIDSGLTSRAPVESETGFGNIYRGAVITTTAGIAAFNGITTAPENYYLNLHSTVNPGGAVREQIAAPIAAAPQATDVISGVYDPSYRVAAPGGLINVYGSNLVRVYADLSGWAGTTVPTSLNGVSATVGGKAAPVVLADPTMITVQVPVDTPAGMQPVQVRNSNGTTSVLNVRVEQTAPGVYFDRVTSQGFVAIAFRPDASRITQQAPARAGDTVLLYTTGNGAVNPPLATGQVASGTTPSFAPASPTITIGGRAAAVDFSIAAPGTVGLYLTQFRVPQGAGTGLQPLVMTVGQTRANGVLLPVE